MFVSFEDWAKSNGIDEVRKRETFWHIYYLLGYVLEGVTVYSVYKLNNWPEEQDIQRWPDNEELIQQIKHFTEVTHLDFFNKRVNPKTDTRVYDNDVVKYSIEGHNFRDIVHGLLEQEPVFEGVPYFGNGDIDDSVRNLIEKWNPRIRYYYWKTEIEGLLTESNIRKLITTCIDIYSKVYKI